MREMEGELREISRDRGTFSKMGKWLSKGERGGGGREENSELC